MTYVKRHKGEPHLLQHQTIRPNILVYNTCSCSSELSRQKSCLLGMIGHCIRGQGGCITIYSVLFQPIIESVDSVCRDGTDMPYVAILTEARKTLLKQQL